MSVLVATLVQVSALAVETLIDYLREPPADAEAAAAQDRACVALMAQQQRIADALRGRLGVPEPDTGTGIVSLAELGAGLRAPDNRRDPLRALAATLWGEARGESHKGKIAVAWVVRNRADQPAWWGRDVPSVCTAPAQFTCWHDDQAGRVCSVDERDEAFAACLEVARAVLAGSEPDPTGGADHYHTTAMDPPPRWARDRKPTCRIGHHSFYKIGPAGR